MGCCCTYTLIQLSNIKSSLDCDPSAHEAQLTSQQQPTQFWLDVYDITYVLETPELINGLSHFAAHQAQSPEASGQKVGLSTSDNTAKSVLLLHVQAAADYYSANETLMQHPPKVNVDIILDPYLAGVVPKSLLPTVGYIVVLAFIAWYVSGAIWALLHGETPSKKHID